MILGHRRQIAYLEQAIKKNRMSHAYLFYGPEHVGKLTVARALASIFHCEKMEQARNDRVTAGTFGDVCGVCSSCKAIERNAHPHVFFLDTAHTLVSEKEERKEIPIDDIRELKRLLSLAPERGRMRIVIINEAEKMSGDAANAFLKLLEEPGSEILMLLVTSSRELIFPTILSRATQIQFFLVPRPEMDAFLEKKRIPAEEREELCGIARSRPGILHTILEDEDARGEEKKFLASVSAGIEEGDIPAAFRAHERIASDPKLRVKYIECAIEMVRAKLISSNTPGTALFLVEKIKNAHRMLTLLETTNVNPRLCLDVFTLQAAEKDKRAGV